MQKKDVNRFSNKWVNDISCQRCDVKDIMEGFEKIGELIFCPFVHYAILLMSISELDLTTLDSNGPSAIDTFVAVRQGENAELISVKVL